MTRAQRELAASAVPLVVAAVCVAADAWVAAVLCLVAFVAGLGAVAWRWRA